jgi:hypothetical protein
MSSKDSLYGRCHCGNISFALHTQLSVASLPSRKCGCSFCSKQQAVYASDPSGSLAVTVRRPEELRRYRFATKEVTFLFCGTCGTLCLVVTKIDGAIYGIVNLAVVEDAGPLPISVPVVDLSNESSTVARERRRRAWIPQVTFSPADLPGIIFCGSDTR